MALADFLADDLAVALDDPFAVSATAGSTTANVLLDMPGEVIAGGMVLSTDYTVTAKNSDFGSLVSGDSITVDSIDYTVRETRLVGDGLMVEIALQKT
jgi:hypothetical protein